MRVAIISANLGAFDKNIPWENQNPGVEDSFVNIDTFRLNDLDCPPRPQALTPRIYSKLIKCFGWQFFPNYDIYIWVDSSFKLLAGATSWLLGELGDKDIAVVKHPWNKTIKEEYETLTREREKPYIHKRYGCEFTEEQYLVVKQDKAYVDDCLFCGGLIVYRNKPVIQNMFKEWWYHITRYHLDDQLSLPYVLKNSGAKYNVVNADIYHLPLIPYMRKSRSV